LAHPCKSAYPSFVPLLPFGTVLPSLIFFDEGFFRLESSRTQSMAEFFHLCGSLRARPSLSRIFTRPPPTLFHPIPLSSLILQLGFIWQGAPLFRGPVSQCRSFCLYTPPLLSPVDPPSVIGCPHFSPPLLPLSITFFCSFFPLGAFDTCSCVFPMTHPHPLECSSSVSMDFSFKVTIGALSLPSPDLAFFCYESLYSAGIPFFPPLSA